MRTLNPSAIYHYAGAPHVAQSWYDTAHPLFSNVLTTHYLLDAVRRAGNRCRDDTASGRSVPSWISACEAPASEKALKRAGMSAKDIDLWELNEAFAAVVLRYLQVLKMPHDKINVNGGAIAMGHPLGATGAMILGTLLDELERRGLSTGLATLCVGAGMGTATIIERV